LSKELCKSITFSLYLIEDVSVSAVAVNVPVDDVIVTAAQEYIGDGEPDAHTTGYAVASVLPELCVTLLAFVALVALVAVAALPVQDVDEPEMFIVCPLINVATLAAVAER